jgi:hypothetical protein
MTTTSSGDLSVGWRRVTVVLPSPPTPIEHSGRGRPIEGGETLLVDTLWLLLPNWASPIAVVWADLVATSAVHRIVVGYRTLR